MSQTNTQTNTALVKYVENTPFTIYNSENGIIITIGNRLIAKGYATMQQAEEEIHDMTDNWPLLVNTMIAITSHTLDIASDKAKEQIIDEIQKAQTPKQAKPC